MNARDSLEAFRRRVGVAGLIVWSESLVAAFGWGNHWNVYTNVSLTLGNGVLWATLIASLRPREVVVTATCESSARKIHAIKEIRAATGLGLREAKEATEGAGLTVSRDVARALIPKLRDLGLNVETRRA